MDDLAALADAYRFAGGLVPVRCRVLGRGRARGNDADVHEAGDVFMYRDSSIAPLLDPRRRFKAVMDVLDSMIRSGVFFGSLSGTHSPVRV